MFLSYRCKAEAQKDTELLLGVRDQTKKRDCRFLSSKSDHFWSLITEAAAPSRLVPIIGTPSGDRFLNFLYLYFNKCKKVVNRKNHSTR